MLKKFFKSSIYLIALTIVSIVGAVLINSALAVWTGPTASPPANNIANLLFTGNDVSLKLLTLTGSNLYLNQTTNGKFYADSKKGVQIRLDSDNNDANSAFTVNNGLNAEVFKIDETGLVTVINKITGLLTPTAATDAATKAYVDALLLGAGTGDATKANQESMMGTGFVKDTDSLKNIRANLAALATSISTEHSQILNELQKLANNSALLTYSGATHTGNDCLAQTGGSIYTSPSGTLCKITGTNVSCPSTWPQADYWQAYSAIGWGEADYCGRWWDSGPTSFANLQITDCSESGGGTELAGYPSCGSSPCTTYWCGQPYTYDGYTKYHKYYNIGCTSPSPNPSTNRTAIGCK